MLPVRTYEEWAAVKAVQSLLPPSHRRRAAFPKAAGNASPRTGILRFLLNLACRRAK